MEEEIPAADAYPLNTISRTLRRLSAAPRAPAPVFFQTGPRGWLPQAGMSEGVGQLYTGLPRDLGHPQARQVPRPSWNPRQIRGTKKMDFGPTGSHQQEGGAVSTTGYEMLPVSHARVGEKGAAGATRLKTCCGDASARVCDVEGEGEDWKKPWLLGPEL
jgi:hypothetical protein